LDNEPKFWTVLKTSPEELADQRERDELDAMIISLRAWVDAVKKENDNENR